MNEREIALQQCAVLEVKQGVYDIAPTREEVMEVEV